ncbi:MAG: Rha family transcriptional regulator [Sarcina sp.]
MLLQTRNNTNKKMIDSREVAEMIGMTHSNLLRKINSFGPQINIDFAYFISSTYIDKQNQNRECYLITKKGCEMIALSLTGEKGIKFAQQYIEVFNSMETVIKSNTDLKNQLLLNLFSNDEILVANSHKKLVELEKAPLLEIIEEQKPKIETYNAFIDNSQTHTITDSAKLLGLKPRVELIPYLNKVGLLTNKNLPSSLAVEKQLMKIHWTGFKNQCRITNKGLDYIRKNYKRV